MGEGAVRAAHARTQGDRTPRARVRDAFREARAVLRREGVRGAIRRYGWKLFAALFAYYLVRDLVLYVALPWLIARRLLVHD